MLSIFNANQLIAAHVCGAIFYDRSSSATKIVSLAVSSAENVLLIHLYFLRVVNLEMLVCNSQTKPP